MKRILILGVVILAGVFGLAQDVNEGAIAFNGESEQQTDNKSGKETSSESEAVYTIEIIIDVQETFANPNLKLGTGKDGNSLYVPRGEDSAEIYAQIVNESKNKTIVLSQDFHRADHFAFVTNHSGLIEHRKNLLRAQNKPNSKEEDILNPMNLTFTDVVIERGTGEILGVVSGEDILAIEKNQKGIITKVKEEKISIEDKDTYIQTMWNPHGVQGTFSSKLAEPLLSKLPKSLRETLEQDLKSETIEYHDESTGNKFHVIRKGVEQNIDSYGIVTNNDGVSETNALAVFARIADDLTEEEIKELAIRIGGLATNFCVEFSHTDVIDKVVPIFQERDITVNVEINEEASRGIPIFISSGQWPDLDNAIGRMKEKKN